MKPFNFLMACVLMVGAVFAVDEKKEPLSKEISTFVSKVMKNAENKEDTKKCMLSMAEVKEKSLIDFLKKETKISESLYGLCPKVRAQIFKKVPFTSSIYYKKGTKLVAGNGTKIILEGHGYDLKKVVLALKLKSKKKPSLTNDDKKVKRVLRDAEVVLERGEKFLEYRTFSGTVYVKLDNGRGEIFKAKLKIQPKYKTMVYKQGKSKFQVVMSDLLRSAYKVKLAHCFVGHFLKDDQDATIAKFMKQTKLTEPAKEIEHAMCSSYGVFKNITTTEGFDTSKLFKDIETLKSSLEKVVKEVATSSATTMSTTMASLAITFFMAMFMFFA